MKMRLLTVACTAIPLLATLAPMPPALAARTRADAAGARQAKRVAPPTLSGVAATSARNAWGVGGRVIMHWNGRTWMSVHSPVRGLASNLSQVAIASADDAWAVGNAGNGRTLIVRWNGRRWRLAPHPDPSGSVLRDVAVTSASNAWAVGFSNSQAGTCGSCRTLVLHWNGRAWRRVASPTPGRSGVLWSIAAGSARSAWAVGLDGGKMLVLHWNGVRWKQAISPALNAPGSLTGVAVTPGGRVWAVGNNGPQTLIMHWNGRAWRQVPSPNAGLVVDVAAASAHTAWAVGESGPGDALILRWNGRRWRVARAPANPFPDHAELLDSVTTTSNDNAWAVGYDAGGGSGVILRWNGSTWKQVE